MKARALGRTRVLCISAVVSLFGLTSIDLGAGPLDRLVFQSVVPTQRSLASVAYGGGKFVAVGGQGTILVSDDGISWSSAPSGTSVQLSTVVFGAGTFVVAASDTYVFHSTDALHWTPHGMGSLGGKLLLTYGGGQFLAIRADGRTAVSSNGADWVSSDGVVTGRNLTAVAYGNGRFVAVGTSVWVSTDGLSWAEKKPAAAVNFTAFAYGNGIFAGNSNSRILLSRDGESWSPQSGTQYAQSMGFVNGQFIATSFEGEWLSSDGAIWEQTNGRMGLELSPAGIAYGAGRYVLVATSSEILVSPDAIHWSSVGGGDSNVYRALTFGEGRFLGVGNFWVLANGKILRAPVLVSNDGVLWDSADSGVQANNLSGAAYGDGRFVVIGPGFLAGTAGIGISEDGETWDAVAVNLPLTCVAHRSGQFIAAGGQGTSAVSLDGLHWTRLEAATTNQLNGVCATQDTVIAVGNRGTLLRLADGLAWTPVDSGTKADLQSVAIGHGVSVAVGASVILRSTDGGLTWTSHAPGPLSILHSVVFGNEVFVAVGDQGTILLSTDGNQWTRKRVAGNPSLAAVSWGGGKFLAAGSGALLEGDFRPGILSDPTPGPDGLRLSVTGEIGRVYRVQMSTRLDVPEWWDLGSVTSRQLIVPFTDPNAGAAPARFYRVVSDL